MSLNVVPDVTSPPPAPEPKPEPARALPVCHGEPRDTPFCPMCGRKLAADPLADLLLDLTASMKRTQASAKKLISGGNPSHRRRGETLVRLADAKQAQIDALAKLLDERKAL